MKEQTESQPKSNALPSSVSVVLRSKDEAWALKETLPALFNQSYKGDIQLIVIDSGSTDGSVELIEKAQPYRFKQIQPSDYVPGVVLNWGIRNATNEWIICLNADATPADDRWLEELLTTAVSTQQLGAAGQGDRRLCQQRPLLGLCRCHHRRGLRSPGHRHPEWRNPHLQQPPRPGVPHGQRHLGLRLLRQGASLTSTAGGSGTLSRTFLIACSVVSRIAME